MAPIRARRRWACASRGTTARRRRRSSACCPIASPVTCRASWIRSSRSSQRSRPPGVWKRRLTVVTLLPDRFTGDARLSAVRVALATTSVLTTLRTHGAPHLGGLPTLLGFRPHRPRRDAAAPAAPHGGRPRRPGTVRIPPAPFPRGGGGGRSLAPRAAVREGHARVIAVTASTASSRSPVAIRATRGPCRNRRRSAVRAQRAAPNL
jgi:hypothetical protein